MTVTPGDPRAGDPVKIRVDGFRDARSVTPAFPFSEEDRQTSEPAPFLTEPNRRRPDVYTLRGGEELYLPLRRTGPASFETASFRWPDEGLWFTTPRFFVGDKLWAFRKRVRVRDGGPPPSTSQQVIELELVDEAAPGRPPDWAKPIAYALIAGFALAALALAVIVARLVRRWSSPAATQMAKTGAT